ncbi:MAG: hypothetical protein WB392_01280 [Methanotrichaceae archaeon]
MKRHILVAILLIVGSVEASTINVCPTGCDYTSIQTGINYADPGDTINVSEGTYKENVMTTKPINIEGAGQGRTIIDGSFSGTVFIIGFPGPDPFAPGPLISLSGLTIEHGKADFGSGIYNKGGRLTLTNCRITQNIASGGAVYNTFHGTIALNGTTITNNNATTGGGIYDDYGTLDLNAGSSITNNTAIDYGGGIWSQSDTTLNLNGSTISGNRAASGGGIYGNGGAINMYSGSVSNNSANSGGGIYNNNGPMNLIGGSIAHNYAVTWGGGIFNNQGTVNLNGSSVDNNLARLFGGGGICNNLGVLNLNGSSIDHNYAGTYGGGIYDNVDTSSGYYSTVNLNSGSIDHNMAEAKLSGGGIYSVYGTVITGNRSLVRENIPDQIRTVGA